MVLDARVIVRGLLMQFWSLPSASPRLQNPLLRKLTQISKYRLLDRCLTDSFDDSGERATATQVDSSPGCDRRVSRSLSFPSPPTRGPRLHPGAGHFFFHVAV